MKFEVELALGTNIGNKEENLKQAMNLIIAMVGEIIHQTKIVETEPFGYISTNNFLNMIIVVETKNSPAELLKNIKSIEKELGRKIKNNALNLYEDRIIDIDILKFESMKFTSSKLNIPHLKIEERNFFNKKWLNEQ